MPLQKVIAKFYQVTCDECQAPNNLRVKKFDAFVKSEVKKEFMKAGWDFAGYPRTVCPGCKKRLEAEGIQLATELAEKAGLQKEAEKA